MTITVYGLKNCDSTRKAVKIIKESGKPAEIHDLRLHGLPPALLKKWVLPTMIITCVSMFWNFITILLL